MSNCPSYVFPLDSPIVSGRASHLTLTKPAALLYVARCHSELIYCLHSQLFIRYNALVTVTAICIAYPYIILSIYSLLACIT